MDPKKFSQFQLTSDLLSAIDELGYSELTPIQAASMEPLLIGSDVLGQAKTGSGKTAAFSIPILQKLSIEPKHLQALILCPTRELGAQVAQEVRKLARKMIGVQVLTIFGGQPARQQAESLYHGVHIVVATPGRLVDLIERDWIDLRKIKTVVLDEADEMLDLGFEDDVRFILESLSPERQTVFFSATFPDRILELSQSFQHKPQHIVIQEEKIVPKLIEQIVYLTEGDEKINVLLRALQQHVAPSVLIFCNQKVVVKDLHQKMISYGVSCGALHGDLEQRDREEAMALFRNKSYRILIATDVAARGLDIENLELVINYDLPMQAETYVHRTGRTGRAGKSGQAITLVAPEDEFRWDDIEHQIKSEFIRPKLGFKNQHGLSSDLYQAEFSTLTIGGGRKDKLRPGDILGALTGEAGLTFQDVGKIDVQDRIAFVAISAKHAEAAFHKLRNGKIKGQRFPIRWLQHKTS